MTISNSWSGNMVNNLQKTIKDKVNCVDIGLHSGKEVKITIHPAPVDHGIVFKRVDITDKNPFIIAKYDNVSMTTLNTTISNEEGVSVSTIEHLMAAFWGCGIDNALVEINDLEVPIMDGSSQPFIVAIECAGIVEQDRVRNFIEITDRVEFVEGEKYAYIEPSEHFSVSVEIDYKDNIIGAQRLIFDSKNLLFKEELSKARTFCFEKEVEYLKSKGLIKGGSLDNAIVVGNNKILNKDGLRYDDEFVRHKILDCIGDFFLAGHIKGHFHVYLPGHDLNNKILKSLFASNNYKIVSDKFMNNSAVEAA